MYKYVCPTFLLFNIYLSATAAWYGKVSNNQITDCSYLDEPIDIIWKNLNQQFRTDCELKTESLYIGFFFHCGVNNNQLLFRNENDCNKFQNQIRSGEQIVPETFAPKGVRNPGGWVVALNSCYSKAISNGALKPHGLQKLSDYCICGANEIATHTEKELRNKSKFKKIITKIINTCS